MTLEQILNLLTWFEKLGGPFPILGQPSLVLIEKIKTDLTEKSKNIDQPLRSKIEKFLNQYLIKTEPLSLFQASLKWLKDLSETGAKNKMIAQQKMGIVFSQFIDFNPEEASEFYNKELKTIYPAGDVLLANYENEKKSKANQTNIEELVKKKLANFQEIEKPLSLLLHVDLSDLSEFASYIIWLLRRGESVDAILQSGILQSFFMYNLHCLSEESNPLQNLYGLLAEFEEADQLVLKTRQKRVQDKAFESYNLQGSICPEENLEIVPIIEPSFIGILDRRLFNKLYSIFGINFLYFCFNRFHEFKENEAILTDALNSKHLALLAIPELIKKLVSSYEQIALSNRLESLINLMINETFNFPLLIKNQVIMLYLLPYRDNLLTDQQFKECIKKFIADLNLAPIKKFDLLMDLFNWTAKKRSYDNNFLIYQSMVTLILSSADLLDIEHITKTTCYVYKVFKEEETFNETKEFLQALNQDLKTQWEDQCKKRLTNTNFSLDDYNLLLDYWKDYLKRKVFFQGLFSLSPEKFNFNQALVLQASSLKELDFVLPNLTKVLIDLCNRPRSRHSLKTCLDCIQALVTVLRYCDSELTKKIIENLTKINRYWSTFTRPTQMDLMEEAVHFKNLELITHLLNSVDYFFDKKSEGLLNALEQAIKQENLTIIQLLLTPVVTVLFDHQQCYSLYSKALGVKSEVFAELIKQRKLLKFDKEMQLSLIIKVAETSCDWAQPMLFNLVDFKLNNEDFAQALNHAVTNAQWFCVDFLFSLEGEFKLTAEAVETAASLVDTNIEAKTRFIKAAIERLNQKTTLQFVESLSDLEGTDEIRNLLITHLEANCLASSEKRKSEIKETALNSTSKQLLAISNDITWPKKLRKLTSKGNLEQVKAIIIAAESNPGTYELIQMDKLKQIAKEAEQEHIVAWFEQLKALPAYQHLNIGQTEALQKALNILNDYTKSDSYIRRFFTGHWNRHHVDAVSKIVARAPASIDKLLIQLKKIELVNSKGSLARRINYISEFLLPLESQELSQNNACPTI